MSMITCDNAGNNNTKMIEIQYELTALNIPFSAEGNRIRRNDVGGLAHSIVTACRASGQRRADFEETIEKGNENGGWGEPPELLRVVGLLKDVDTRWSSIFLMIDRVLELYQAIDALLGLDKYSELSHLLLTDLELQVLRDVRQFLQVPHVVQELVSAEKTPTLCIVLPLYERLIIMLRDLKRQLPKLGHAISAAIRKLEEYLALSRCAPIYALAMVLHPTIKFKWIEDHWSAEDYQQARASVRASVSS
ncbi:hypothetical protein B0H17DRAFT_1164250 [Mycena rosella]|uniref:Uncharacterized protein n=1 Tax=Mycena rosella TaxID=1033263 RepID=A0AAD7BSU8_MYCRO|nr:hypothetical protein B0H17DRAFT_1164250 [Mycena rosella]